MSAPPAAGELGWSSPHSEGRLPVAALLWRAAVLSTRVEHAFDAGVWLVPEPVRIVREPGLPRISAAARAILGEMTRPRPSGEWASEYLAPMFASRAVAADDDHGRGAGIVTQADGLRWDELYALAAVTESMLDWERHSGPGTWHPGCAVCTAISAHRRITNHRRYQTVGPDTPRRR